MNAIKSQDLNIGEMYAYDWTGSCVEHYTPIIFIWGGDHHKRVNEIINRDGEYSPKSGVCEPDCIFRIPTWEEKEKFYSKRQKYYRKKSEKAPIKELYYEIY